MYVLMLLFQSADKNEKFFSADYRSIVCLNVIEALKLDAQVNCVYLKRTKIK